jgi:ABC-type transporter Mla subunit MlaD
MATDVDTEVRHLIDDVTEVLNDLDKEEDIEREIIQEQEDAEQKLAEALQLLKGRNGQGEFTEGAQGALQALLMFRQVDFSAPPAEVHQQVEKIINAAQGINDAATLQDHLQEFHHGIGNIEKALEELQDVYQKTQQDAEHQQHDVQDLKEIQQVIGKIEQGAQNYSQWAQGNR